MRLRHSGHLYFHLPHGLLPLSLSAGVLINATYGFKLARPASRTRSPTRIRIRTWTRRGKCLQSINSDECSTATAHVMRLRFCYFRLPHLLQHQKESKKNKNEQERERERDITRNGWPSAGLCNAAPMGRQLTQICVPRMAKRQATGWGNMQKRIHCFILAACNESESFCSNPTLTTKAQNQISSLAAHMCSLQHLYTQQFCQNLQFSNVYSLINIST